MTGENDGCEMDKIKIVRDDKFVYYVIIKQLKPLLILCSITKSIVELQTCSLSVPIAGFIFFVQCITVGCTIYKEYL